MKSFAIGKVLDPENLVTAKGKNHINFGLLIGKASVAFDVWDDASCFKKAEALVDGDTVCIICNAVADDKGKLRTYVNDIAEVPEGLREELLSLFK